MNDYVITFLRALVAFATLFSLVRLMGRKQMSQMTFADYVVGIAIGALAATVTLNKSIDLINGILAIGVWCGLAFATGYLALKNLSVRKVVFGEPLIVIDKGKAHAKNMAKANYSVNDLLMQLREKDVFDISKVDYALLEANGQLSVLKKPEDNTVTLKDMGLPTTPQGLMTELVIDGRVLSRQLVKLQKNEAWLLGELGKQGVQDVRTVLFAGLLANGQLYVANSFLPMSPKEK